MMIGELNFIAPYVTNFFMISYALINYSCFASSVANVPGWRPTFRYYNPYVAAVGVVLCVGAMFMIDWVVALITFVVCFALYSYIRQSAPDVEWGSVGQARAYKKAVENVMHLEMLKDLHRKNYRPAYLIMASGATGEASKHPGLVNFVHQLKHGGGLSIAGRVIYPVLDGESPDMDTLNRVRELQTTKLYSSGRNHARIVPEVVTAPTLADGCRRLLQTAGVGKLRPNTVLFGYKSEGTKEYVGMIRDAFAYEKGVGILRDYTCNVPESVGKGRIDVWWLDDDGGLTLLLPYLLLKHKNWKRCQFRVYVPRDESFPVKVQTDDLNRLFYRLRIKADVHVTSMRSLDPAQLKRAYENFDEFLGSSVDRATHLQMKRNCSRYRSEPTI